MCVCVCVFFAFVGLDNKRYKMHGTYIKREIEYILHQTLVGKLLNSN